MSNPYNFRGAIHNPKLFFGYRHMMRMIYSALIEKQSTSIIGLPHSGKSSLLLQLADPQTQQSFEFDLSHHVFVLINLSECLKQSCDDFFEFVSQHIEEQCLEKMIILSQTNQKGERRFRDILKQINKQGYHTVLLIDAFDNVVRNKAFDPNFFSFLRSQAYFRNYVSYVTSSIAPLEEICHGAIEGSPFFNIFTTIKLVTLTQEEAQVLIIEPAAQAGYTFEKDEISWILSLTGHYPYFIQCACHFLFEAKQLKGKSKIDRDSVQKQINEELLSAFAYIQDTLKKQELGAAKPTQMRLELNKSLLFRKFTQEVRHMQAIDLTLEELEQVLSELSDSQALGASRLRLLKIVSRQTQSIDSPSSFDTAKAIRTVLQKALDRMQGSGQRQDNAIDWRLYNILYYRYFKHQLKHQAIETRLEFISTRTYFRSRDKALKTLLAALVEMEAECTRENRTEE